MSSWSVQSTSLPAQLLRLALDRRSVGGDLPIQTLAGTSQAAWGSPPAIILHPGGVQALGAMGVDLTRLRTDSTPIRTALLLDDRCRIQLRLDPAQAGPDPLPLCIATDRFRTLLSAASHGTPVDASPPTILSPMSCLI